MVKYAAILRYGELTERDRTATRALVRIADDAAVTPAAGPAARADRAAHEAHKTISHGLIIGTSQRELRTRAVAHALQQLSRTQGHTLRPPNAVARRVGLLSSKALSFDMP